MKIRCYFRDTGSSNHLGRVDVTMNQYYDTEDPYLDAISEVQTMLWQNGDALIPVFAIVK